ncbi:hypothetical protein SLEP1_g38310 [Rubroshorea leprosula]|uniref:Uncharacterized protein n=1 Tax=Rubroshorea leprosula TaxID=152421 RepID=A0AAV5KY42_9ROSI|nr:hypothetical protein SLEP1_g38310 [Rubroshorea leprosula]
MNKIIRGGYEEDGDKEEEKKVVKVATLLFVIGLVIYQINKPLLPMILNPVDEEVQGLNKTLRKKANIKVGKENQGPERMDKLFILSTMRLGHRRTLQLPKEIGSSNPNEEQSDPMLLCMSMYQ